MTGLLPKKHFLFLKFADACKATKAWWGYQDEHGMSRTLFNISSDGPTNVFISDKSLADQSEFMDFLSTNFAGKYTVHNAQQVHTWLDGAFGD